MNTTSVSKLILNFDVSDKTFELQLKKHLAPSIVNSIQKILPMQNNVRVMTKFTLYIVLKINEGMTKTITNFKKCDVAYNSLNDTMHIFMIDANMSPKMTLIGKITSNCERISEIKDLDKFKLYC